MFYRKISVQHILEHQDFFKNFIWEQPFDEYIKDMSKSGEWGGHTEL